MINPSIFLIVFFGYFGSFIFYFLNFEQPKEELTVWGRQLVFVSLFLHFMFLLALVSQKRSLAITSVSEYVYVVSFLILLASRYMESKQRARFQMLFSLPIAMILCLLAIFLSPATPRTDAPLPSGWLWLHTGFIVSGFAGLILAASTALMYLLQSAQLKSKHLGRIFLKLPSLDTLDKIHFRSLAWGVILFSLGIASGLFWAGNIRELNEVLKDPKVILSFVTCAMYWIILSFRLSALRRGQKIAAGTVLLFLLLLITLMSSYYAPSGFHRGF